MQTILNNQNGIKFEIDGETYEYKLNIHCDGYFKLLQDFKTKIKDYPFDDLRIHFGIVKGDIDSYDYNFIHPAPSCGLANLKENTPFSLPPLEGKWKLLFRDNKTYSKTLSLQEALTYEEPVIHIVGENYSLIQNPTPLTPLKRIDSSFFRF